MTRSLLNFTTTVSVARTLGEIQGMLAEGGASAISVVYADRQPVGLTFTIGTEHGMLEYRLPVKTAAVLEILGQISEQRVTTGTGWQRRERRKLPQSRVTPEHAACVGWRVVRDWLEAQLALIEIGLVTFDEIMLPYLLTDSGSTVYEMYVETQKKLQKPPEKG